MYSCFWYNYCCLERKIPMGCRQTIHCYSIFVRRTTFIHVSKPHSVRFSRQQGFIWPLDMIVFMLYFQLNKFLYNRQPCKKLWCCTWPSSFRLGFLYACSWPPWISIPLCICLRCSCWSIKSFPWRWQNQTRTFLIH